MNEELYHLLDGDLPDEASVEVFRSLADSREQRELFREQARLQGALYRNDSYGAMSADEETEMLGRMGDAIGMNPSGSPSPRAGRRFAPLALALLGIGLLVGGGTGFVAGGGLEASKQEAVSTPPVPVEQAPALETHSSETPTAFDRDSVVAAIRDSVVQAMNASQTANATKRKVRTSRRGSAGDNDPTGAAAARELARKKKAQSSQNNE